MEHDDVTILAAHISWGAAEQCRHIAIHSVQVARTLTPLTLLKQLSSSAT